MKTRKTVEVENLRALANTYFRTSGDDKACERLGIASFLEVILQETGNYKGFNYLSWLDGGAGRWHADGQPADNTPYLGDQTRRFYF